MFLTPVINLSFSSLPPDQRWIVPTGEFIYSWGILLEVFEGDIINISMVNNIENFPIEVIPLIFISTVIIISGGIINYIKKIPIKLKYFLLSIILNLGSVIGLYSMIRIAIFGYILKQTAIYF